MKHLVLGGVKSGKSVFAEQWICQQDCDIVYIATNMVWDEGMQARVAVHRARRPATWELIEEPVALGSTLTELAARPNPPAVILECLSLWMTNLLCAEDDVLLESEYQAFLMALATYPAPIVMVSAEVGLGVMPENALGRKFADRIGVLNQTLGQQVELVTFVAAGLPLTLKSTK